MTGNRELLGRLSRLDKRARRSVAGKVLRAGGKVMRQRLKAGTPRASGAAGRALITKVKLYGGGLRGAAITGERQQTRRGREKGAKWKWGGPHLHLAEYGTRERFQTGQKRAERRLRALQALSGTGLVNTGGRIAGLRGDIAIAKARSRVARALAGGASVGRAALADLRKGRPTGRVTPRRFWRRLVSAAAPAVHAMQAAVLKREIEGAWNG